jgi:CheY-like chemotaxis protein
MSTHQVLVVDDNAGNRDLAIKMLKITGITAVDAAASATECLAAVTARSYDCLLMDISMPEVSGLDLCRLLRGMPGTANVRIVACTAHASPREAQAFLTSGFNDVLTKPFLIDDLKRAICSPVATTTPLSAQQPAIGANPELDR